MIGKALKKHRKRRWLEKHWETVAGEMASCPITEDPPRESIEQGIRTISSSCSLYPDNSLTKKSLKLISATKRILVDRRQFDLLKSIDYLLACHNVAKFKINQNVKEKVIAYFCQMSHRYLDIVTAGQQTNPFHPGIILGGERDRSNAS